MKQTLAHIFSNFLLRLNLVSTRPRTCAKTRPQTLRDLFPGSSGRVIAIDLSADKRHRLFEMGLTPGTLLEVIRFAPLGDPIQIKVRGYHLSLRRREAAGICIA